MGKIAIKTNATADISSILPEVLRFYDATATSTITLASGTNNITSWGDRSVNNIAATQTVGSEQPIYNPASKSINLVNKSFQIYFGVNAFSGIVYIADSVHGVLDFNISVGSNSTLDLDASPSFLTNLIGVVITSNLNHKNVIENYFGSKSQNLKYSNAVDTYIISSNGASSSSLLMNITTVPLINTRQITTGSFSFLGKIRLFPYLETTTTQLSAFAYLLISLKVFPPINTSQVREDLYAWSFLYYLIAFPAFDSRDMNAFYYCLFRAYSISQLSLDNVLISLAAGVANNIGKSFSTNAAYPTILNEHSGNYISNINRRPPTFTETQDNIPTWNNIINEYKNGQKTETVAENELINLVDEYNIKWKTWEQALRSVNESLNGVQYNFSNGTVSGQKAYYWMVAKKNISMPQLTAPTTLTTEVTRSYRSNSGLTVSGSNVSAWTPVTVASNQGNQTIYGLTTQTINGITCVMFSNTKTITFNSTNVGTGHRVYIGTLYGYVKITPPTATNLKISTDTITELPIISIMVTTTAVNETEVLLRLGFYGSFQEFNYTTNNNLASANIQLTAV